MRHRFFISALIVFTFLFADENRACTCIGNITTESSLKKCDVAFYGKIISQDTLTVKDDALPPGLIEKKVKSRFVIHQVFKGKLINDTVTIVSGVGHGDCGFLFSVGKKYIVYSVYQNKYFAAGSIVPQFLETDICSGSKIASRKDKRLVRKYAQ